MNARITMDKIAEVNAGMAVVMSDAELDWLADNDKHPKTVVSIRNPNQVGTLDSYLVANSDHPVMLAERSKQELLTSATRASIYETNKTWDEPAGASSQQNLGRTCRRILAARMVLAKSEHPPRRDALRRSLPRLRPRPSPLR